ncbi:MAG: tyrosine-type recombinase/integrase [Gemmobacter sp.]|nr:tyrosine-type recombinase/integrase [Gemmobacter sp.]
MTNPTPYLELRPTGYFWRRRVPVAMSSRYSNPFFCFPLKTDLLREAAAVAGRITAISDICFRAEIAVPPDVMTRLLVTYARLEIETADRIRALTGPRSRAAADASLAVEAAIRASLRDAILRCERDPALRAIESTARHLGLTLAGDDEDMPVLADKMLRLMLEVSEERERRARGHFAESQPFLALALSEISAPPAPSMMPQSALAQGSTGTCHLPSPDPVLLDAECSPSIRAPLADKALAQEPSPSPVFATRRRPDAGPATAGLEALRPVAPPPERSALDPDSPTSSGCSSHQVLFEGADCTVQFASADYLASATAVEPTLLELFDEWFASQSKGIIQQGHLQIVDKAVGENFQRNGGTTGPSRKFLMSGLGRKRMSETSHQDWQDLTSMMLRMPRDHGKSKGDKDKTCEQLIVEADAKDAAMVRKLLKATNTPTKTTGKERKLVPPKLVKRMTPRTVQRHQTTLSSAFKMAVARGRIEVNRFAGFVLKDKTVDKMSSATADTTRKLWGDEFQRLLSTSIWNASSTRIDDERYWAPLIARLMGPRSEEILQANVADVRCSNGLWYLEIRQGTGQSLKSENARRMLPIHSQLIELGFLALVEHQRQCGEKRLFPRATRSKTKKATYTANFTKNFTYYRRTHGVYEEHMDFHALRTTFNSSLVGNGVPDTARRYLMGHKNPDVGITNYLPAGFPLETLKAFIEQVQLDLSMVTQRFGSGAQAQRRPVLAVSNVQPMTRRARDRAAS